jgi:hypothetical protein
VWLSTRSICEAASLNAQVKACSASRLEWREESVSAADAISLTYGCALPKCKFSGVQISRCQLDRMGTRADVETSLEFVNELRDTLIEESRQLDFPAYLRTTPSSKHRWERHNDYEHKIVDNSYARLFPKWNMKVKGTETYLRDNCWAMLESLAVQFPGSVPGR